ncbi:MAG: outer membrane beta-barrel protein [Thermoanaerobaculia bacterium]
MRRVLIALAAVVILAAPSWAKGGGAGFFGTWADSTDAGNTYGGGGIVEFGLGAHWDMQFRGTRYVEFSTDFLLPFDDGDVDGVRSQDFDVTVLELGVAYNFNSSGNLVPYVGGGFSYLLFDLDPPQAGEIKDEGGFYALGGVEIALGETWGLFVEGMYRNVKATLKGDDLGFQPVDHEVNMSGGAVNVGLKFNW